ncbi:hypothetical protein AKJ09_00528 [Labilithrix luteola]|uniref:Tryptophan synthase alpha chain n=1 Tax=Labilithrix luteola TaxID=1391654 RepID=A0A0K1PL71_9BACT|nr:hypothetical protein [Labilithrix luteola]AKU93864.1 hypothetical protein AKJ09_00528 [Labilithrix luteola]
MSLRAYRPILVLTVLTSVVTTLQLGGCAENSLDVGTRPDADVDASPGPSFTQPADGDASADANASVPHAGLCISTECPSGYATCDSPYACGIHLTNDNNNCGACGNACPQSFGVFHLSSSCIEGQCRPICTIEPKLGGYDSYADCNGIVDDGCEIRTSDDPNNCGACGNACAPGVGCHSGKCGCGPGQAECADGRCYNIDSDNNNCGGCGIGCEYPADAAAPPPHAEYGCVSGKCGELRCMGGFGDQWADCDGDLHKGPGSNGCEVNIGINYPRDPNNCGACGNKCTAAQICYDGDGDRVPECLCQNSNETMCGSLDWGGVSCHDLLNDPKNCGTCNHACQPNGDHTAATCNKGVCEATCEEGWGDCDGRPETGCETNLKISGANCGACGTRCDTQAGQPCVEGKCATTDCDAGPVF